MPSKSIARRSGLIELTDGWQQEDGRAWMRDVDAYDPVENVVKHAMLMWDVPSLTWVKFTGGGGGGGGGGPVTIADAADVAQGAKADSAWDHLAGSASVVGLLKAIATSLFAGEVPVVVNNFPATQTVAGGVDVNNFPDVSKEGTPITGQALEAGGANVTGWLSSIRKAITDRLGALGQKTMANSTPVVLASDQPAFPVTLVDAADVTQGGRTDATWDGVAVSASIVALLKYVGVKEEAARALLAGTLQVDVTDKDARVLGRAKVFDATGNVITVAKDSTLTDGTQKAIPRGAGKGATAAGDVTSTAASANRQPMDVLLYDSAGNVLSPALDATLTGGTQKAIARGGAKGATAAADLTGTAEGADHQALDVQIYHGGATKDPTQIRALTNADIVKAQLQDNGGAAITVGQKAMASSVPVVIASDQSTLTTQAAKQVTYTATYRLAARPYAVSFTSVANTRKVLATLFHAASAAKTMRLRRVLIAAQSFATAGIYMFDLVKLTAATTPATGNPAITPTQAREVDSAAEATALALPTTPGTEGALINTVQFKTGITGADPTSNPPSVLPWTELYSEDEQNPVGEQYSLEVRNGIAGGWAVVLDPSAAGVCLFYVRLIFTEA